MHHRVIQLCRWVIRRRRWPSQGGDWARQFFHQISRDGGRWARRSALGDSSGTSVIAFSETIALAGGETYRLTAAQSTVPQMDITGGEVVIERLG